MNTNDIDDEECSLTCDCCGEPIAAGQPVHEQGFDRESFREGAYSFTWSICDHCETNVEEAYRAKWTRTREHRCDCPPCQSRRLVGGLVASVALAGKAVA